MIFTKTATNDPFLLQFLLRCSTWSKRLSEVWNYSLKTLWTNYKNNKSLWLTKIHSNPFWFLVLLYIQLDHIITSRLDQLSDAIWFSYLAHVSVAKLLSKQKEFSRWISMKWRCYSEYLCVSYESSNTPWEQLAERNWVIE